MTAEDPCCIVCQSRTGVCLSLHQCHHHKQAQRQLEADDRARRTHRDDTADRAIRNIMSKKRGKQR